MESTVSTDGTPLSFARQGTGDPVLLVHGTTGSAGSWAMVASHLESRFSVVAMDRRGRGGSGDGAEYSIDHEAADVAAVVDAIGGGVHVVGHSYGARVALQAAVHSDGVRSLVLYEPPLAVGGPDLVIANRTEELVRAGEPDAAARLLLSELGITTPEELEFLQGVEPVWDGIRAGISTAAREIREESTPVDLDAIGRITVPVLILLGEKTTLPAILTGLDEFERAFQDARRATIPGQRHLAVGFAPEAFAERVQSFLVTIQQGPNGLAQDFPDPGCVQPEEHLCSPRQ